MLMHDMTRKDFDAIPGRKWDEVIICDSLVILPGRYRDIHESGYRLMDAVAIVRDEPVCRVSGCSDVFDIEGIGGDSGVDNGGWSIDCLKKSGLLRLFPHRASIKVGPALSNLDVCSIEVQTDEQKEG